MIKDNTISIKWVGDDRLSPVIRRINIAARRNARSIKRATTAMTQYAVANRQAIANAGRWAATRISAPLTLAAGASLRAAATMEQYSIALSTMTGNAERGKQALDDLVSFASRTPFQTETIVAAGKQLLGFQVDAEKLIPTLTQLGDLASGTGVSIGELAQIYGKAFGKQKLQAMELNQMAERGIPIMATLVRLAEESGQVLTTADIYKMASEGKITFADFARALDELTRAGGKFYNLTEKQSQSLGGLFSTTTSKLWETGAAAGEVLSNVYNIKENLRGVNEWLDSTKQAIESADAGTQAWVAHIGVAATAFAPMAIGLAGVLALANAIGLKFALWGGIIAGALYSLQRLHNFLNPNFNPDTSAKGASMMSSSQNFAASRALQGIAGYRKAFKELDAIRDRPDNILPNNLSKFLGTYYNQNEAIASWKEKNPTHAWLANMGILDRWKFNRQLNSEAMKFGDYGGLSADDLSEASQTHLSAGRGGYDFGDDREAATRGITVTVINKAPNTSVSVRRNQGYAIEGEATLGMATQ